MAGLLAELYATCALRYVAVYKSEKKLFVPQNRGITKYECVEQYRFFRIIPRYLFDGA